MAEYRIMAIAFLFELSVNRAYVHLTLQFSKCHFGLQLTVECLSTPLVYIAVLS